jgi:hypothetical protein
VIKITLLHRCQNLAGGNKRTARMAMFLGIRNICISIKEWCYVNEQLLHLGFLHALTTLM